MSICEKDTITPESASLGTLLDDDVIIIARSTARRSLSTGLGIGSRLPAYCSAMGRVLLASMGRQETMSRVRKMTRLPLTPQTITDASEVLERIERCRAEGYATNEGELEVGVRSMAVPVVDRHGQTVAAMSIAMRTERMEESEFEETFRPILHRAQATLSRRLLWTGLSATTSQDLPCRNRVSGVTSERELTPSRAMFLSTSLRSRSTARSSPARPSAAAA